MSISDEKDFSEFEGQRELSATESFLMETNDLSTPRDDISNVPYSMDEEKVETEVDSNRFDLSSEWIGQSVSLWSDTHSKMLNGILAEYNDAEKQCRITFQDEKEEWISLNDKNVYWDEASSQIKIKREPQNEDPPPPPPVVELPAQIDVCCNKIPASFLVKERMIVSEQGLRMTPREFERACGKGAAKKWKNSIKVKTSEGAVLLSLGEWLIRNGCDPPHPTMEARRYRTSLLPRSGMPRPTDSTWFSHKQRRQKHQPGCQCAVCVQLQKRTAQRYQTGRLERDDGNRVEKWQPATTLASLRAQGPGIRLELVKKHSSKRFFRFGKRAFIRALPHGVGNIIRHELHEIPPSKCWSVQEWLNHVQGTSSETPEHVHCKTEKWRMQLKKCNSTQDARVTFGKVETHSRAILQVFAVWHSWLGSFCFTESQTRRNDYRIQRRNRNACRCGSS